MSYFAPRHRSYLGGSATARLSATGPFQSYDWGAVPRRRAPQPDLESQVADNRRPLLEPLPVGQLATYDFQIEWNPGGGTPYDHPKVLRCQIRRGRRGEPLAIEQGRCTLTCYDPDGVMNPANPASPLVGNLKVMRRVHVAVAPDGVPLTRIFSGFVSRIWHDGRVGVKQTLIEAVDAFELMNVYLPTYSATGPILSGTLIGNLLTAIGITNPADRLLDTGSTLADASADGTKTNLTIVQEVLAVDKGVYFVTATGAHAYADRTSLYGRRDADATFTPALVEVLTPSIDVLNVVNRQVVQRTGGSAQTATDATSIGDYGTRNGSRIESTYIVDDTQAASLASFVVQTRKDPDIPARTLRVPGMSVAQLQQQATRDVGDVVTLSGLGTEPEARIEGIAHDITDRTHVTDYEVTTRSFVGFIIGVSTIEGPDLIAY